VDRVLRLLDRFRRPVGSAGRRRIVLAATAAAVVLAVGAVTSAIALRPSGFDRVMAAAERTEDGGTARLAVTTVAYGGVGSSSQQMPDQATDSLPEGTPAPDASAGPSAPPSPDPSAAP
jgi:hypothetical protein